MLKNIENLGKTLSKDELKAINGGYQNCGIFLCVGLTTEGCECWDNPNSDDGRGTCLNGMCCD